MPRLSGQYGVGAFFILISALLHLAAVPLGALSPLAVQLGVVGLILLVIVAGLTRGMRWLAWISFFIMGIGGSIALSYLWTDTAVPTWLFAAIMAVDWLAALGLLAALWRNHGEKPLLDN